MSVSIDDGALSMLDIDEGIKAWHFLSGSRRLRSTSQVQLSRLRYTGKQVRLGDEVHVAGPIKMGGHGLHASVKILDALRYAPGPICCEVIVSGTILHSRDRIVGSSRQVIGWCHAGPILWDFARHHFDLAKSKLMETANVQMNRYPQLINWISLMETSNVQMNRYPQLIRWISDRFLQTPKPNPTDLTSVGWDKIRMLFWDALWVVGHLECVTTGIATEVDDPFSQLPDWRSHYNKVSTALESIMLVACNR